MPLWIKVEKILFKASCSNVRGFLQALNNKIFIQA
jgi:hypothetical protein